MIIFGKQSIHFKTWSFDESMKQEYIVFWKSLNSIAKFVVLIFFHTFHDWIKFLNLKYE
jgi:hypothetical protein